jgi:ubiquinone/menaquinone biosynthesis C-methylase UbiE
MGDVKQPSLVTHETYTNVGSVAYVERHLARRGAADAVPFLLPYLQSGQRLLDCGCGPGSITLDFAARVAPGEVCGVDFDRSQIEAAQKLAAERGVDTAHFEVASIYALPYPDASFDVVTAVGVLMHLREPVAALREMRRVLRPGGVIALENVDVGAKLVSPPLPSVLRLHEFTHRVMQHSGGNPYIGRDQRRLLLEAGFESPELFPLVRCATTLEGMRQAVETGILRLQGPAQEAIILGEGWATRAELDSMYAEVRLWAERPDAFLFQLWLGALARAPLTNPRPRQQQTRER